jgi:hypothetical protein
MYNARPADDTHRFQSRENQIMIRFTTVATFLFVVVALSQVPGVAAETNRLKVLIVTGFDVASHVWEESARMNQAILEKTGHFEVTVSTDKEIFASPKLGDYQVVVLNYGFWEENDPSQPAKDGLLEYVKNGGNVVALHFACSSFQDWDGSRLEKRDWRSRPIRRI